MDPIETIAKRTKVAIINIFLFIFFPRFFNKSILKNQIIFLDIINGVIKLFNVVMQIITIEILGKN
jgi:hypothetical protein